MAGSAELSRSPFLSPLDSDRFSYLVHFRQQN
jgi:hypothetical protein